MDTPTLWPAPRDVKVDHIIADDHSLTLIIHTCRATAVCPACGQPSERVHSRYQRSLADLPWHGVTVQLRLQTRRFFCTNTLCQPCIFTERLPALVAPYARRTLQLQEALHLIGLALGGRGTADPEFEPDGATGATGATRYVVASGAQTAIFDNADAARAGRAGRGWAWMIGLFGGATIPDLLMARF